MERHGRTAGRGCQASLSLPAGVGVERGVRVERPRSATGRWRGGWGRRLELVADEGGEVKGDRRLCLWAAAAGTGPTSREAVGGVGGVSGGIGG